MGKKKVTILEPAVEEVAKLSYILKEKDYPKRLILATTTFPGLPLFLHQPLIRLILVCQEILSGSSGYCLG